MTEMKKEFLDALYNEKHETEELVDALEEPANFATEHQSEIHDLKLKAAKDRLSTIDWLIRKYVETHSS
jgi:uncharacterized membrane protein